MSTSTLWRLKYYEKFKKTNMGDFVIFDDLLTIEGTFYLDTGEYDSWIITSSAEDTRCWLMERLDHLIPNVTTEELETLFFDVFSTFLAEKDMGEYMVEIPLYEPERIN